MSGCLVAQIELMLESVEPGNPSDFSDEENQLMEDTEKPLVVVPKREK